MSPCTSPECPVHFPGVAAAKQRPVHVIRDEALASVKAHAHAMAKGDHGPWGAIRLLEACLDWAHADTECESRRRAPR
jgi:hypothetical protein